MPCSTKACMYIVKVWTTLPIYGIVALHSMQCHSAMEPALSHPFSGGQVADQLLVIHQSLLVSVISLSGPTGVFVAAPADASSLSKVG